MRQKRSDYPVRVQLIHAATSLFLEHGFTQTTNKMIVTKAGCSPGQFSNFFRTKENILLEFLKQISPYQLEQTKRRLAEGMPPVMSFCKEIAVLLSVCEIDEPIHDLYKNAYSLPITLEYIKDFSYKKAMLLFGERLPDWNQQDFYETEIVTTAIIYGCLMEKCSPRFSIERKVARAVDNLMKIYDFPKEERMDVISDLMKMNILERAEITINNIHNMLAD